MKKILLVFLILTMSLSLISCGKSEGGKNEETSAESEQTKVEKAVESRGLFEYYGSTIGDNELKSSSFEVSTLSKVSSTEYRAYGQAKMTDVYGNVWTNTFSCEVEKNSSGEWSVSNIEYTSKNWTKK